MAPSAHPETFGLLATITGEYCNEEILCRLIHFWEARHFKLGNILMGYELLLIDSEGNTIQGFISANRLFRYERDLKANSVYKLKKFMVKPCKPLYKTSDHKLRILFTDQTTMTEVPTGASSIDHQRFRIRPFSDFSAIAGTETDLFDVLGQIRHVLGDNFRVHEPDSNPVQSLDTNSTDRVYLHLLMTDGETVRVNLWGNFADTFRQRWNKSPIQPAVVLITTVSPKTIGGAVNLNSTPSTRVFIDSDLPETRELMSRLSLGALPTVTTASSAITKLETLTINELHQFLQTEDPQIASFYCVATIVEVLGQYGWNYISCSSCPTKLGKTETSMYCTSCKKNNNVGILRYRFELAVRDENKDLATFVVFDGDGFKLAGCRAPDVLKESHEVAPDNDRQKVTAYVPDCLQKVVGRTCKFQVQVRPYNFSASRQTFTVSRIVDENVDAKQVEENFPVAVVENKTDTAQPSKKIDATHTRDKRVRQPTNTSDFETNNDIVAGDLPTGPNSASTDALGSASGHEEKRPRLQS